MADGLVRAAGAQAAKAKAWLSLFAQQRDSLLAHAAEQARTLALAQEAEASLRQQLASAQAAPSGGWQDPFASQTSSQLRAREGELQQLREALQRSSATANATIGKLREELAAARAVAAQPLSAAFAPPLPPPLIDGFVAFGEAAQPNGVAWDAFAQQPAAPPASHHVHHTVLGNGTAPQSAQGYGDAAARIAQLEAELAAQVRATERAEQERDRAEAKLRLRAVEVNLLRKSTAQLHEHAAEREGGAGPPQLDRRDSLGSATSFLFGPSDEEPRGTPEHSGSSSRRYGAGPPRSAPAVSRPAVGVSPAQAYYESRQRQNRFNLNGGSPSSATSSAGASPFGSRGAAPAPRRASSGSQLGFVRKLGDAGGKLVNAGGKLDELLDRVVDAVEKAVDTAGEKGRGALGKAGQRLRVGKSRTRSPPPTNSFLLDDD
ncbi:hypothetical protein T492DRAFT_1047966 [Pavlovales sp. CCMP2436]|nr:hypothetical protein T492DRAFT_1047966 [Pavlovales sp. CCMP2436]